MQISAIIPTYNRAHTLVRAINSVLEQSMAPAQVIVVDDGSTDDTASVLAKYGDQIEVVTQQNHGVSHARNRGIEAAKCAWIALLDSDDCWHRDKLLFQSQLLSTNDELACHTDEVWIRNGIRVNPMKKHAKPDGWIFFDCLALCCVSPSSVLLHQTIFEQVGLFDESLPACEDYDMWLRIFSHYSVCLHPEKLVKKFGGHDDQLSRKFPAMDRFRVTALEKLLQQESLPHAYQKAVMDTLAYKLNILIQGAQKRGKLSQASAYQQQLEELVQCYV